MKLIAFGANLPGHLGGRRAMIDAALLALPGAGITVEHVSPLYEAEPYPPSEQDWYINGVALVRTALNPKQTVDALLEVEADLGRKRTVRNAARSIDLDLLAYDGSVLSGEVEVPHPRMADRNFVLQPLMDIAPQWVHPTTGLTARQMLDQIKVPGGLRRLAD